MDRKSVSALCWGIWVGTVEEIMKWKGGKMIDLNASEVQLIFPGFIDLHTNFVEGKFNLTFVQLWDAKLPPETEIFGDDWDHKNRRDVLPEKTGLIVEIVKTEYFDT